MDIEKERESIAAIKVVNNMKDTQDALYQRFVTLLRHNAPNLKTSLYEPRKRYSGDACIISRFEIVKCA